MANCSIQFHRINSIVLHSNCSIFNLNQQTLAALNIPAIPVFAYSYKNQPKNQAKLKEIKRILLESGMKAAFRIGNNSVSLQVNDSFELNRININGFDY